jgi:uncharacterized protein YjbJ (UPF0337 family)
MDKEHLKGAADKAKGAVKDTAGKMTGDKKLQAEGKNSRHRSKQGRAGPVVCGVLACNGGA